MTKETIKETLEKICILPNFKGKNLYNSDKISMSGRSAVSHHKINLDFYKTGDGTKQFWGHE